MRRLLIAAIAAGLLGAAGAGAIWTIRPDLVKRVGRAVLSRVGMTARAEAPADPPSSRPGTSPDRRPDGSLWETTPVATNLMGPFFWGTNLPFIDLMRSSGTWGSRPKQVPLALDPAGWPTRLASGQTAVLGVMLNLGADRYPTGRYTVLYEGRGQLQSVLKNHFDPASSRPGREILPIPQASGQGILISLSETHPSDPVRNVRVLLPGGVCANDATRGCRGAGDCTDRAVCEPFEEVYATQIFNPAFLARLRGFSVLRFMDWMGTNGSNQRSWRDRPQTSDRTWTSDQGAPGVPIEILVALANRTGAHPWFTIPHEADDDYVRRFAKLVRDRLDPSLRAWVEYSNEVWNGGFPQHQYAQQRGRAMGLSGDATVAAARFYSERSVEIFRIFDEVFDDRSRLVRVLASQSVNPFLSRHILSWKDAWKQADVLATAPYFSLPLNQVPEAEAVEALSPDALLTRLRTEAVPRAIEHMRTQREVADAYGLRLVAYEGGQHMVGGWPVRNRDALNSLLDEIQRHPAMKQLYLDYLRGWKEAGGTVFVHFSDCGSFSKYGRWGALEHIAQPRGEAPKFDAVQTFGESTAVWW